MTASFDLNKVTNLVIIGEAVVLPVVVFIARRIWIKLKSEFSPNHGSSMKDAMNRIENELLAIRSDMKAADRKQRKEIKRVARELAAHLDPNIVRNRSDLVEKEARLQPEQ